MATVIRAGPSASAASSLDAIAPTSIPTEPDTNDSAYVLAAVNRQTAVICLLETIFNTGTHSIGMDKLATCLEHSDA
jgi:hypothetical protein